MCLLEVYFQERLGVYIGGPSASTGAPLWLTLCRGVEIGYVRHGQRWSANDLRSEVDIIGMIANLFCGVNGAGVLLLNPHVTLQRNVAHTASEHDHMMNVHVFYVI